MKERYLPPVRLIKKKMSCAMRAEFKHLDSLSLCVLAREVQSAYEVGLNARPSRIPWLNLQVIFDLILDEVEYRPEISSDFSVGLEQNFDSI